MKVLDRDLRLLKHIVSYCEQINMAVERFGADPVYRNAVSLCILQIGELVSNLSDAFRQEHPAIPWRQIKLMRNIVAHRYGTVDHAITWDVVEHDIPLLKSYCEGLLQQDYPSET